MKKVFLGLVIVLLPAFSSGARGAENPNGNPGVTGGIDASSISGLNGVRHFID